MTSPLPPKRRDTRDWTDLVRQDRTRLSQIDRGLASGKHPPLRPVRLNRDSDDVEDDLGDEPLYAWKWGDRYTATAGGNQRATLTYIPVDESLFVRWHPNGRGGVPLTNEHFSVSGRIVTILDPGLVAAGDQFSFQYQYDPDGEDTTPDAFTGITLIGTTYYYGAAPHPTSFALPAGTSDNDLIVVGAIGSTGISVTDPRLSQPQPGVWVGRATDLSAVLATSSGTYLNVMVATFRVNVDPSTTAQTTGSSSPLVFPTTATQGAVAVGLGGWSVVDGSVELFPSPWTDAGGGGTGKASSHMALWYDLAATTTPSASVPAPSCAFWSATILGFGS